uniref:Uncharacterized protein n=1 Tax=Tetraselmis sp. GSL018 TaxID=582737 RepID=A0A061QY69_9CHLO
MWTKETDTALLRAFVRMKVTSPLGSDSVNTLIGMPCPSLEIAGRRLRRLSHVSMTASLFSEMRALAIRVGERLETRRLQSSLVELSRQGKGAPGGEGRPSAGSQTAAGVLRSGCQEGGQEGPRAGPPPPQPGPPGQLGNARLQGEDQVLPGPAPDAGRALPQDLAHRRRQARRLGADLLPAHADRGLGHVHVHGEPAVVPDVCFGEHPAAQPQEGPPEALEGDPRGAPLGAERQPPGRRGLPGHRAAHLCDRGGGAPLDAPAAPSAPALAHDACVADGAAGAAGAVGRAAPPRHEPAGAL